MKNIYLIFKKELANYFNSAIAYIFMVVFLLASSWLFFQGFFIAGQASMRSYFFYLPWIFLFLMPALTMRLIAEEKKSGTIELLLTLPIKDWEVILAKFFSALAFLAVMLILSLPIPLIIFRLGTVVDLGPIVGGYLGSLLVGAAFLALGLFISTLNKNQIISFVLALAAGFFIFILGVDFVLMSMPGFLAKILSFLCLGSHFENIAKGVIDTRDLIYYFSFIYLFLYLSEKALAARSWK
jgi:ABC-2 type transport system permease protein